MDVEQEAEREECLYVKTAGSINLSFLVLMY